MNGVTHKKTTPKEIPDNDFNGKSAEWLKGRGIDLEVAIASGVAFGQKKYKPVIGFSYTTGDKVEAVKYRSANGEKVFWWEGNAQRLWGKNIRHEKLDDIDDTIVITE